MLINARLRRQFPKWSDHLFAGKAAVYGAPKAGTKWRLPSRSVFFLSIAVPLSPALAIVCSN
jgi:hypothetical protein